MNMVVIKRCVVLAAAVALLSTAALAQTLVPGGQSIGVAVKTGGVMVIGASDVGSQPSPARLAGLRSGDIIIGINGVKPESSAGISALLDAGECTITYERAGKKLETKAKPVYDEAAGAYRLGVWVRDSAMGVGTLTFVDPETGRYGALGHAITDADAGIVLPLEAGTIYENSVVGIEKGKRGEPGEILGKFYDTEELGSVDINSTVGIFGTVAQTPVQTLYPDGLDTMPAKDVRIGKASILTTVKDGALAQYDCEILRVDHSDSAKERPLMLQITDKDLLNATGGIVQGMSGSPIIQDGKLVGAVTHVLINDPTRGYGIFIENMLEAAE